MTLYRQLLLFLLALIFLLFSGTWLVKLESTRSFIFNQLESHAQDTATSLGLSLSPYMAENDIPTVETMINAVFDRGYYRIIRLSNIEGTVIIDRTLTVEIENIPKWFIKMLPIETPSATSMVMAGWHQAGSLYVESHPGHAYKTLWETIFQMTLWFLAIGCVVAVAGGISLRFLLRPLERVERQANALCQRQYNIQKRLPRTRELRRVVEAMNRMTNKVKVMFDEHVQIAEKLRKIAYQDSLTGLGNRRYLASQITTRLAPEEGITKGAFLLIQIHGLQQLNQERGLKAGDLLLKEVAVQLQNASRQITNSATARLTGGDFGLLLPDATPEDTRHVVTAIFKNFSHLTLKQLTISDNVGHIGGITYDCQLNFGELLSMADIALRAAQKAGPNKWSIQDKSQIGRKTPQGEQKWKEILDQVLAKEDILLYAQPVVQCKNLQQIQHVEIFARIKQPTGQVLNAGIFIPMAERLNLISSMDRIVLKKAMRIETDTVKTDWLAVNISPTSLLNKAFHEWILSSLHSLPKNAPRLIFEFSEFNASYHIELIREFSLSVRRLGHGLGLDHFGQSFSNFGYLKYLQPDYVKIDRAFISELKRAQNVSQFFIGSLCNVAHSIDIQVIAEGVETEEQLKMLRELNLDAVQGYFIDRPCAVDHT